MENVFKFMSFCWIVSPVLFVALRLADVVNIHQQNCTIFLVLCGISYVAIFLNSGGR